jgi:parvulin-like peptidyl-prolyl isomerase
VTAEDLKRGYEANYGPKVRCRAIVMNNARRAQEVWEKARANKTVQYFGELAEQYSIEASSRSLRGEVPPIQKHGGQPSMEKEAFSLTKEEPLSGIVQMADSYIILFYEGRTESINASFEEVKSLLERDIHEKKLRIAMAKFFEDIKDNARIDNYLANNFKVPKKEEKVMAAEPPIAMPKVIKR